MSTKKTNSYPVVLRCGQDTRLKVGSLATFEHHWTNGVSRFGKSNIWDDEFLRVSFVLAMGHTARC
jgi:hypothetical protein